MSIYRPELDSAFFNRRSVGFLPGLLGIRILEIGQGRGPNGPLLRSMVALTDSFVGPAH